MRIKEGFRLRSVLGESVVVGEGVNQINFSKIIALNESAALLWQAIEGKEFSNEDLANILVDIYEIDQETALRDAWEMTEEWKKQGLLDD